MATTVINIKTGQRYDIYCGRAGRGQDGYFGNPYPLQPGEPRGATLDRYRAYFYDRLLKDPEFMQRILSLRDKVLGCFCKPYACHCDIIIEYLDHYHDWLEDMIPDGNSNIKFKPNIDL